MQKEPLKTVEKVWGEELWLVNNDLYCGKLLIIDRDAEGSYHYHKNKTETFFSIEGYVTLTVEGKEHLLAPFTRAKTIYPYEKHSIKGITEGVILEVSTPHFEDDVIRIKESISGVVGKNKV